MMNKINSVCVYSASSTKIDPVYFTAAETLGRLLADHHIRLINGCRQYWPDAFCGRCGVGEWW